MIIFAFLLFIKNNFEGCERYWWDIGFQVLEYLGIICIKL